jgi:hypothetical protein
LMTDDLDCSQVNLSSKALRPTRQRTPCTKAVRLAFCLHCSCRFAVCRSCDRGQAYCSRRCASSSRTIQLRESRRRYRHSAAGSEAHREQEGRRRERRRRADSVGDHPSQAAPITNTIAPRRIVSSSSTPQWGSVRSTTALECHRCLAPAAFVAPLGWCDRRRPSDRAAP